jgi:serine phosphatase RsbU (regulator of sigma subunit)
MNSRPGLDLDYAAVFAAVPAACVVLDQNLVIVAANDAYLRVTGRERKQLIGRPFFDAFPQDPGEQAEQSAARQRASFETVLATGAPDTLTLHRFAIPRTAPPDGFEPRWWNIFNAPQLGPDGSVRLIVHRVDDVTDFARATLGEGPPEPEAPTEPPRAVPPQAELFARARELQRTNYRLRHEAERTNAVALTLQRAMLSTPDLEHHPEIAVRYRPAQRDMNACGDWYDVVDLGEDRIALSVGDVVGHGVEAASVMGMLRSAYNASVRIADGPSGALEVLGLYSRAHEAAMATTTVACQIYLRSRLLTYSNAGHPPALLIDPEGACRFLDQATDPPLGVRWEHVPRPQASLDYVRGELLVLYTDGLIERRGEDIDVGMARLARTGRELRGLEPGDFADGLLERLENPAGAEDDVSLLVARL